MAEPIDEHTFAGPHPTAREFYDQLLAWGFTRRRDKGVHALLRAPHGGTLRLLRSLAGRADAALVDKAARIIGVTVTQFWAGPTATTPEPEVPQQPVQPAGVHRRPPVTQDRATSLVLGAHIAAGQPLGFDEVVKRLGGRATRDQVRSASATLCRDGDLDRVRSGVYQWAAAARATNAITPGPDAELHYLHHQTAEPAVISPPPSEAPGTADDTPAAELFVQLFPDGVRMTPELFADFQRWTRLTEKLAGQADAS